MSSAADPRVPGELPQRLAALDVYRGLVMLLMMAEVLELNHVAKALHRGGEHSPWESFLVSFGAWHQTHVPWIGCTLHDLIQPSFSFLVGAALPFSLARRKDDGEAWWVSSLHAFGRALILVLLGVFLRSFGREQTNWTFEDTLTQIGLGYGFLYLLALCPSPAQWATFAAILVGYWAAFAFYPLPGAEFDWQQAGVEPGGVGQLIGFEAHWSKNTNLAWAFDTWFLNLFPREKAFTHNGGGYATLSFIPTLATMILGLLAGNILRGEGEQRGKVVTLFGLGLFCLAAGWLVGELGLCPIVKRIWTPSWVLYSGGWCLLFTAGFYAVTDIWQLRGWAFPLTVLGMNSIAAYLLAHVAVDFLEAALPRHLGAGLFELAGQDYQPLLLGAGVLLCEWLALWWMYRQRMFVRI